MLPRQLSLLLAAFTVLTLMIMCVHQSDASATASAAGVSADILGEDAIIVWDEANKTEHLIYRATFLTGAKEFGFLVPTPTEPEFAEAEDANQAFGKLEANLQAFISVRPGGIKTIDKITRSSVSVPDRQRVAGQDRLITKAADSDTLGKWFNDHNYDFSPPLKKWLKRYADAGWFITATKFAKGKDGQASKSVGSSPARFSFKTDKPILLFSEPATQRDKQVAQQKRLLRVFFLAKKPPEGKIGYDVMDQDGNGRWVRPPFGLVRRAFRLFPSVKENQDLMSSLKLPADLAKIDNSTNWRMTVFEDWAPSRVGGTDLTIVPDPPVKTKKG